MMMVMMMKMNSEDVEIHVLQLTNIATDLTRAMTPCEPTAQSPVNFSVLCFTCGVFLSKIMLIIVLRTSRTCTTVICHEFNL